MRVLFRVDAGRIKGISFGHFYRCLNLALKLRETFFLDIVFVMKKYSEVPDLILKSHNIKLYLVPINCTIDYEYNLIYGLSPDILVIDMFESVNQYDLESLKDVSKIIVLLDDLGNKNIYADIIINSSIVTKFLNYGCKKALFGLGPKYFILNKDTTILPRKKIRKKVKNILITMGGSDPQGITHRILKFFSEYSGDFIVNFIFGPGYKGFDRDFSFIKSKYCIYRNPKRLDVLINNSDIVLCAGGRTAYEVAYLGRPAIIIPSIEHEEKVAKAFYEKGIFWYLSRAWLMEEKQFINRLEYLLEDLLDNYSLRMEMSQRGVSLIDGKGLERTINLIKKLLSL